MPMAREIAEVAIRDWSGLVTHSDRQDVAPGAGRLQVNMQSDVPGLLRVRRGLTLVQFDARGLVEVLDIVSVQEAVFLSLTLTTAVSETVSLSEALAVEFAVNPISDSITVGESLEVVLVNRFANVQDSVAIGENLGVVLVNRFASVADSVALTESVGRLKSLFLEIENTVTLAETISTYTVSLTDTPWSGATDSKLYLTSGQFSSTLRNSISTTAVALGPSSVSWDGTNSPWCSGLVGEKSYLTSGQFASTIKTSQLVSGLNQNGISWDGTNTPVTGTNNLKLLLVSGQFSSTIKTSVSVSGVDSTPRGISWDGTNTPWTGSTDDKLYLQSAQFTSTVKTSVSVSAIDTEPTGIETNNVTARIA